MGVGLGLREEGGTWTLGPRWEGSGPDSGSEAGGLGFGHLGPRGWGRDLRVQAGRSWGLDSGFQENGARVLGLREGGTGVRTNGSKEGGSGLGSRQEGRLGSGSEVGVLGSGPRVEGEAEAQFPLKEKGAGSPR